MSTKLTEVPGLGQKAEDFPTPPVPAAELKARLDAYNAASAAAVVAETAYREQHAVKHEALEELVDGVKANLRYAEIAVRDQPEKLSALGVDGGAVGVYKIQRKREGGPWEDAGISTDTEQLLSNQPRGVEFHYRVFAVNKAGIGQPSATVTVVL